MSFQDTTLWLMVDPLGYGRFTMYQLRGVCIATLVKVLTAFLKACINTLTSPDPNFREP